MPEIGKLKSIEQGSIQIASVTSGTEKPARVDIASIEWHGRDYSGAYTATPSAETQTFPTRGKNMTGDFVVEPIPSNYGLITWNGSVLTVS